MNGGDQAIMEFTINLQDLFLIIAGLSIVAITVVLIPLFVQLKKTVHRAEELMGNINGKLAEADVVFKSARQAGETLLITTNMVKTVLTPFITNAGGISSGLKAFMSFIRRSSSGKEKETKANE